MNLDYLIEESNKVLLQEFQVTPEKSIYVLHPDWETYLRKTGTTARPHGIYLPRTFTANLDTNSPYFLVNLLHEYFGHGLFCEHSLIGQKIVSNEEQLMDLELKMSGLDTLSPDEILQIPANHPLMPNYRGIQSETIIFLQQTWGQYEGFALWMEHHLAQITGNLDLFIKKLEDNSVI